MDVYPAREPVQEFPYQELLKSMHHPDAKHMSGQIEISNYLVNQLQPNDILIILSAGDADQICRMVLDKLQFSFQEGLDEIA